MPTLYEKIGGAATIEKLVATFYQNVLGDPLLRPFFANTSIECLKRMQVAFFTIALDGPEPDLKVSLYESHRNRGIQRQHLTRFTEHLVNTLAEVGIQDDSAQEIYRRIATYSDEVLGDTLVDG